MEKIVLSELVFLKSSVAVVVYTEPDEQTIRIISLRKA